jgi:hypothetical protein
MISQSLAVTKESKIDQISDRGSRVPCDRDAGTGKGTRSH